MQTIKGGERLVSWLVGWLVVVVGCVRNVSWLVGWLSWLAVFASWVAGCWSEKEEERFWRGEEEMRMTEANGERLAMGNKEIVKGKAKSRDGTGQGKEVRVSEVGEGWEG